jgi:PASTA domain
MGEPTAQRASGSAMKKILGSLAAASLLVLSSAVGVAKAAPASWYVTPAGSDLNSCVTPAEPCATINGAIGKATAGDAVRVGMGTYTASGNEVVLVDRSVTVEGGWNDAFTSQIGRSTIDGGDIRRGIVVDPATEVTVDSFVVQHGNPGSGQITAGGVLNSGTLTLSNSRVVDSYANEGAGIANGGTLHLFRSTVSGNESSGFGGGIVNYETRTLTIAESTVAQNSATIRGGGIYFYGASVSIRNSTLSGNTAGWEGGGVYLSGNNAVLDVSSSTIASNSAGFSAGGGIYVGGGVDSVVTLRNTILGDNSASGSPDCRASTPVSSGGFNLVESTTGCAFNATDSDFIGVDPLIGPLADNGGPTPTQPLLAGSLANDNANPGGCLDELGNVLTTDQRGAARPLGNACDIGAFEAEPPVNDDFAEASLLDGLSSPIAGSNAFATNEDGEPDHADIVGGASVWYSWTPSFTGTAFVSTTGSSFDTIVGVYTGSSVSSHTTLTGNDDATVATVSSKACFQAAAGTAYKVAVDGFAAAADEPAAQGSVTLAWGQYTSIDPCAILPPTVTGTPQVGRTLTATTGTWAGTPSGFAYQWIGCDLDGCFELADATAATYTPPADAEGLQLSVLVTAKHPSDPTLDAIGHSALTGPVIPAPPSPTQPGPPPPPALPPPPPPPPPALPPPGAQMKCVVPNVKGKTLARARRLLASKRCALGRVTRRYSRKVRKGRVIAQTPRGSTRLPRGGRVNLLVSRGRR